MAQADQRVNGLPQTVPIEHISVLPFDGRLRTHITEPANAVGQTRDAILVLHGGGGDQSVQRQSRSDRDRRPDVERAPDDALADLIGDASMWGGEQRSTREAIELASALARACVNASGASAIRPAPRKTR